MKTSQSISGIAYHRPEVWAEIVQSLRDTERIAPIFWIAHEGEGEDKPHIHFYILGQCKTHDTEILPSLFGIDVMPDGSRGSCLKQFRIKSPLSDWMLYAVHDAQYLLSKGEVKEVFYKWDDIKCVANDRPDLERAVIEAKGYNLSGDKSIARIKQLADLGWSWEKIMVSGLLPISCIRLGEVIYLAYMRGRGHD